MSGLVRERSLWTIVIAMAFVVGPAAQQSSEVLARRQFQNGLDLLKDSKFAEAMRDFQAIVEAYPASTVADDALLELARYQLLMRNLDGAQSAIDQLHKVYATGDAAPAGYVIAGQIALARGRQPANIERALAEFQRVLRLFPGTDAVPSAMLARADTLRVTSRCPEALGQYGQLALEYPRSPWAARGGIGASRCQVMLGRPFDAMASLQASVQNPMAAQFGEEARGLNSILYRLYLRPPQPPFAMSGAGFAGTTGRIRDVIAVRVLGNHLVTVNESGIAVLDLAKKGAVVQTLGLPKARGGFFDADRRLVLFSSSSVMRETDTPSPLFVLKNDKSRRGLEDIMAVAALSTGELIVADGNPAAIHRFDHDFKVIEPAITGRAHRLAVGSLDQIAALDRDEKSVAILTREGKPLAKLAPKGSDWQLNEPVDIAFDVFDHLYVLDRGLGTVWVFVLAPAPKLLTLFTVPEKAPGAFRRPTSFAVDQFGRLFIYDDRLERVQVYQ